MLFSAPRPLKYLDTTVFGARFTRTVFSPVVLEGGPSRLPTLLGAYRWFLVESKVQALVICWRATTNKSEQLRA